MLIELLSRIKNQTFFLIVFCLSAMALNACAQDKASVDIFLSDFPHSFRMLEKQNDKYVTLNYSCDIQPRIQIEKNENSEWFYTMSASGEAVSDVIEKVEIKNSRVILYSAKPESREPNNFMIVFKPQDSHQYILEPNSLFPFETRWVDERYKSEIGEISEDSCP